MRIDAHMHMWNRLMLPDEAIRSYMEPVRKFKEMYGNLFDFGLDDEVPYKDYDVPVDMPLDSLNYNDMDYGVVLITDFGLVGGDRMSLDEYTQWIYDRCQVSDKFLPFIGVDPNRRDACEIIERYVKKYNPLGIKMYPATGFYPDDPKYDEYWRTVEDFGLVVTTHTGMALAPLDEKYCHPEQMRRVAEMHPDTKFIIAHLGGKFHDELLPLMRDCDNVYADCSALQGWCPDEEYMVNDRLSRVMGEFPDRIVFGTDYPQYDERYSAHRFIELI